MKIYGSVNRAPGELLELASITIQASPSSLRKVAEFIRRCAEEMETDATWEHEHLKDSCRQVAEAEGVDVVIFRGQ